MASFLTICQKVASDAGTVSHGKPTTVVGQTDYLAKVVRWTADAWRQIQNQHATWRWMQAECYGNTTINVQRYAYTSFNDFVTTTAITRFADWIVAKDGSDSGFSLYDTTLGVSDEGRLTFREWDLFYKVNLRGTQTTDKPTLFTITPDLKIALAKTPNSSNYRIRGRYRKDEQTLSADADVPECPTRFHDAIVDVALMMLGTHDESPQIPLWQMRKSLNFCNLERDQLPEMKIAECLA